MRRNIRAKSAQVRAVRGLEPLKEKVIIRAQKSSAQSPRKYAHPIPRRPWPVGHGPGHAHDGSSAARNLRINANGKLE
jgi:hypothetical protein